MTALFCKLGSGVPVTQIVSLMFSNDKKKLLADSSAPSKYLRSATDNAQFNLYSNFNQLLGCSF